MGVVVESLPLKNNNIENSLFFKTSRLRSFAAEMRIEHKLENGGDDKLDCFVKM